MEDVHARIALSATFDDEVDQALEARFSSGGDIAQSAS